MKSSLCVILFLVATWTNLRAQDVVSYNQQAETYFKQALTNFEQRNFIAAGMMFQQVEKDFPLHQRTTAAIVMEGKSLFHLALYDSSIQVLAGFLRRFPASTYPAFINGRLSIIWYHLLAFIENLNVITIHNTNKIFIRISGNIVIRMIMKLREFNFDPVIILLMKRVERVLYS